VNKNTVPFNRNSDSMKIIHLDNQEIVFPERTARLLYFSNSDPRSANFGLAIKISINLLDGTVKSEDLPRDDPSTIFIKMPIEKPLTAEDVPGPGYYPNYAGLTSNQKWIYLNWLRDVTQPIIIGYVFIYYYGLERHLIMGDYDLAFEEILLLREHHNNNSFISYSTNAMRYSSLFKKQPNRLKQLYKLRKNERFDNFDLLIANSLGYDLPSNIIMKLSTNLKGVNKRYINSNPDIYTKNLESCLTRRFGNNFFPFSREFKIPSLPKRKELIFANITFPDEIRTIEIPNFFDYEPFVNDISEIFAEAHEMTKKDLRDLRRSV
jgi:hypothetical protein